MDSGRGTTSGRRRQKKDKNKPGNVCTSPRTRISKGSSTEALVTPVQHRPSALQILSKKIKKRKTRSSSSPSPAGSLPQKRRPRPAKLKRETSAEPSSPPPLYIKPEAYPTQQHVACSSGSLFQGPEDHFMPVPLPRQNDGVLLSPLTLSGCDLLLPQRMSANKRPLKYLRAPKAPQRRELSYQEMIREQVELAQKEERRVQLGTCERLKNMLMLPKAHKWVIYEWFYSDIDRVLFEGDNSFETCLKECFPSLKVRQMRRVEWCKVRRMMGKPRRSSARFFEEEREQLAVRREKIRMMQGRKQVGVEWRNLRYLPDEIPTMLTIGTSVSARVRTPQDGIFQGTVEGVDTSNNTYRISFGRDGLGTCSIPDYEVRATSPPETVLTASLCPKILRKASVNASFKFKFRKALLLQENLAGGLPESPFPIDSMLGGFPLRCLEFIVRQSKLLNAKRSKLGELSELNVEAEKMKTYGKVYPEEFRKRYALCILELERINEGLDKVTRVIQVYMEEIAEDAIQEGCTVSRVRGAGSSSGKMVNSEKVMVNADKEARDIVTSCNFPDRVRSPKVLELVRNMASVMLQARALGTENGERKPFELQSMRDTVGKMKEGLEGKNMKIFEDKVDIPLKRILTGLCVAPTVGDDKIF